MKNCEYYRELISACIDEELDHATRADVIAHMTECRECRDIFRFYRELHFDASQIVETAPLDISRSVMQRIALLKRAQTLRRSLPYALGSIAAVLVIAVTVSLYNNSAEPEDQYMQQAVTTSPATIMAIDDKELTTLDDEAGTDADNGTPATASAKEVEPEIAGYSDNSYTGDTSGALSGEATQSKQQPPADSGPDIGAESSESYPDASDDTTEPSDSEIPGIMPITMMADPLDTDTAPRMFSFSVITTSPVWTDDGRLDLASSGEISFIVVSEGDDSYAEQTQEGIAAIVEQFANYRLEPSSAHEPDDSNVIGYMLYFADGSIMSINLYDENHCIECDGEWYAIQNGESLPPPVAPPDDEEMADSEDVQASDIVTIPEYPDRQDIDVSGGIIIADSTVPEDDVQQVGTVTPSYEE